jgi:hypothetical protein
LDAFSHSRKRSFVVNQASNNQLEGRLNQLYLRMLRSCVWIRNKKMQLGV